MRKFQPSLSIVLPFYNEQKSIPFLLNTYKKFKKKYNFELICVNNGSTDGSEKVFQSFIKKPDFQFVKVATVKNNIGYGHGIMTGVRKASGEIIAWTHADMQTHPSDVFKAYEIYKKENNQKIIVKGNRIGRHSIDTIVSFCMGILASIILKGSYYEINAQPKLFHKSFIKYLIHTPNDFLIDLYLLFIAKQHHFIIRSFTVQFNMRKFGRSKWAYSFRSRFAMIKNTVKYIFSLQHKSNSMKQNIFITNFISFKNWIEISSRNRQIVFFFISIIVIVIAKCIQFPILTIHAEMFSENGSNFFLHAYQDSFFDNLFIPDAGYLPLTQRFITLILVKGLHIIHFYPYVSQGIAILFIATASSLINFDIFKKLSSSVVVRFIIGISIGLISDFELNAYMNFIYYGGIILFLGIILDKEKLSRPLLLLASLFTALIMLSKGQFVSFIPIYFFLIIWYLRKKLYHSLIYSLTALVAGLIQFGVISSNAPHGDAAPKLILFPYYFIKSVYYLVLTYRHVFFGYVTKEPLNIISIGLLIIFFTFAIKTLIFKKNKYILYVFLAGNFIAVCSLFLTILLYSQTNPVIKNLTTTLTNTSNVVTVTEKATNEVYDNSQNTKNIFDVKHHANARGLFVSNVLIFLVGIFVLLNLFPKKRDQIFFLLLIVFTSGAFGQLQVEQMYMQKSTSYSQWETYYHLLQTGQYCIPVNNYPFLINKNCNYLLLRKNSDVPLIGKKLQTISLTEFSPLAKNWSIQAIVLINKSKQFTKATPYTLFAYGVNGKILGKAEQLFPSNYEYLYYIFDKPVSDVQTISFRSPEGKNVMVNPNITVFGTYKDGSSKSIEY